MQQQPEITLERAAGSVALLGKVFAAIRDLETSEDVRKVIASEARGEVVVIDHENNMCALRVAA
jgi:hypothetical protein